MSLGSSPSPIQEALELAERIETAAAKQFPSLPASAVHLPKAHSVLLQVQDWTRALSAPLERLRDRFPHGRLREPRDSIGLRGVPTFRYGRIKGDRHTDIARRGMSLHAAHDDARGRFEERRRFEFQDYLGAPLDELPFACRKAEQLERLVFMARRGLGNSGTTAATTESWSRTVREIDSAYHVLHALVHAVVTWVRESCDRWRDDLPRIVVDEAHSALVSLAGCERRVSLTPSMMEALRGLAEHGRATAHRNKIRGRSPDALLQRIPELHQHVTTVRGSSRGRDTKAIYELSQSMRRRIIFRRDRRLGGGDRPGGKRS